MHLRKDEIFKLEKRIKPKRFFKIRKLVLKVISCFSGMIFSMISYIVRSIISILILVILGIPLFFILVIRKTFARKRIFIQRDIIGKNGSRIKLRYFNFRSYMLRNISLFFYVITREINIAGVTIKDGLERTLGDSMLYEDNPGIFNLWYVRNSSKTAHEGKYKIEWEYVFKRRFFSDMMLILKSIPAFLYHEEIQEYKDTLSLFGLNIDNLTMNQAIELIHSKIITNTKRKIYFVNPDCLNKIFNDRAYYKVLDNGDHIFPDGIGIKIAGKILKNPLKENVNGTDLLPFLCESAVKNNQSIFLLGGKSGVADKMKKELMQKYKGISIAGTYHGFFDKVKENDSIIEMINKSKATILLIAFGAPFQEKWIDENFDKLDPIVQMGVGGLFDFYSGNTQRAPRWMREVGLEWFYRFTREPKRMWKRYFVGNPVFIYRILKFKFRNRVK
ncbi:MAG: WecB/TagA/CpsF family glycosyltransferase [Candidatus Delongbacteria bacterium]|nr:WecB/TagA/CpsF family glycosyltransferase [Candidatus Delongbacteria bacterium]